MVGKETLAPEARLEIPAVDEKLYARIFESLADEGITFVTDIKPLSIDQLAGKGTDRRLSGHTSILRRSNVPPQIKVAIDPNHIKIEDSNNLSTDEQIRKIKEREAILKEKLPEDVRNIISMLRPKHTSILVQLDLEHQRRTGRVLFTDWFGRTDDQTSPDYVVCVGRTAPTNKLHVDRWNRFYGYWNVFALSMVVLPRKSAV